MKRLVALMLVLVMSLSLVACGNSSSSSAGSAGNSSDASSSNSDSSEPSGEGLKIGIITLNMEAQYWLDVVAGLKSVIEANGGTVVHYSSENDVQQAVQQIEDMIVKEFDYIAVTCVDKQGLHPALVQAHDAGIPVIIYDKTTDDTDLVLTQIQTNDYDIGFYMGNLMAEMLGEKGKVMSVTTPSVSVSDRNKGFQAAIDQYPNMELIMGEAADALSETTLPVVESILQVNPDVVGWLGINETQSMGAISAIESAGMLDQITIIDMSASATSLAFVKEGKQDVTIDQQAYEIGVLIGESALKDQAGEEVESYIAVPWYAVTKDNVEEYEEMVASRS